MTEFEKFLVEENKELKKKVAELQKELAKSTSMYMVEKAANVYSTGSRSLDSRLDCIGGRLAAA